MKRLEEEAQGYKQQIVLKATGEVARFNEMLPQYLAAPQLTRERIYLDTMEEIYSKVNKVVVDLPEGTNSMIYLPLDKLVSGKTGDAIRQSAPVAPTPRAPADELTSETMGQASVPLRSSDRSGGRY